MGPILAHDLWETDRGALASVARGSGAGTVLALVLFCTIWARLSGQVAGLHGAWARD